jgi:hypothetical protein
MQTRIFSTYLHSFLRLNLHNFEDIPESFAQDPLITIIAQARIVAAFKTAFKMQLAPATILLSRNDRPTKNNVVRTQVKRLFLLRKHDRLG